MKYKNVLINVTKDVQEIFLAKNDVSVMECIPVKIKLQKRNKNV